MPDRNMLAHPAPLIILLLLAALLLYWPTVVSLFQVWTSPSNPTYSHGLLLVAISGILLYRRWRKLPVELEPNAWGLLALAATSFLWLLAHLGQVLIVQQLSLLASLGLLLWAVVGYRSARKMAFPVLLLLFAMPFWEFLNIHLQYMTANIVTVLLNNTGFTSVVDRILILVPAGTFEVSPDCSGLSQLIVAMMTAALYSHVNELPLKRALILAGIAMLVAIAANTLRIYTVVVAGQLTNMQHYFVAHHWTLGWVVFGIGMFGFLLWANRYVVPETSETKSGSESKSGTLLGARAPSNPSEPSAATVLRTVGLALAALAVGPVLAHIYTGQGPTVLAQSLAIPEQIDSWQAQIAGTDRYRPRFYGADLEYDRVYRAADGASVYLYVAYYARQEQNKEAVYYANRVYDGTLWKSAGEGRRELRKTLSRPLKVKETRIQSTAGGEKIVWQWYYVNGSRTSNDFIAKMLNVAGTLWREPSIAVVVVATDANGDDEKARLLLTRFVIDSLEKLERGIDAAESI